MWPIFSYLQKETSWQDCVLCLNPIDSGANLRSAWGRLAGFRTRFCVFSTLDGLTSPLWSHEAPIAVQSWGPGPTCSGGAAGGCQAGAEVEAPPHAHRCQETVGHHRRVHWACIPSPLGSCPPAGLRRGHQGPGHVRRVSPSPVRYRPPVRAPGSTLCGIPLPPSSLPVGFVGSSSSFQALRVSPQV